MTITKACKCDGCGKCENDYEYSIPKGWRRITISKGSLGDDVERHACSKACTASVLRVMADEMSPMAATGGAVSTGAPYR